MKNRLSPLTFFLLTLIMQQPVATADEKQTYRDKDLSLRFIQLSPRQIGSFYEGREFKKTAVDMLMSSCYVTVIIQNTSDDFLWIDTDRWVFVQDGRKIIQQDRRYWSRQWDKINLKQAHRSTFSWTLMPAERNLYPQESVGGRVPIPMQTRPFTVILNFPTGENKQGKIKSVKIDNIICKQDNDN
ncbi:hypothetical protein MNBD_GAMMA11-2860 [hydrothermal vent metagenome]|uniref:Uncharacterized protein n=1 Tax=hydrothermal vent metagenome TaxID=652676 RepID=A0A3B0XQW7_9ZZZZ